MRKVLILVGLWLCATAAAAHEGKGPHGGPVADAGKFYVEVIAAKDQLQVYVYDDATGKPVAVKDAHATAVLLAGTQKETVTLMPDKDDNELSGKTSEAATAGARVVVVIEMANQPSIVARIVL